MQRVCMQRSASFFCVPSMNRRRFTLAEARALLPQVRQWMAQARQARAELVRLRPEIVTVLEKAALNGGSKESGAALPFFQQLEAGIKGIQGLGVDVKDVDQGIVDFPGTRRGREVCLCWRHDEEDIGYWHDPDGGFAGRRPIDDQVD